MCVHICFGHAISPRPGFQHPGTVKVHGRDTVTISTSSPVIFSSRAGFGLNFFNSVINFVLESWLPPSASISFRISSGRLCFPFSCLHKSQKARQTQIWTQPFETQNFVIYFDWISGECSLWRGQSTDPDPKPSFMPFFTKSCSKLFFPIFKCSD